MPESLLESQFAAVEPPAGAIRVDVAQSPEYVRRGDHLRASARTRNITSGRSVMMPSTPIRNS